MNIRDTIVQIEAALSKADASYEEGVTTVRKTLALLAELQITRTAARQMLERLYAKEAEGRTDA